MTQCFFLFLLWVPSDSRVLFRGCEGEATSRAEGGPSDTPKPGPELDLLAMGAQLPMRVLFLGSAAGRQSGLVSILWEYEGWKAPSGSGRSVW